MALPFQTEELMEAIMRAFRKTASSTLPQEWGAVACVCGKAVLRPSEEPASVHVCTELWINLLRCGGRGLPEGWSDDFRQFSHSEGYGIETMSQSVAVACHMAHAGFTHEKSEVYASCPLQECGYLVDTRKFWHVLIDIRTMRKVSVSFTAI